MPQIRAGAETCLSKQARNTSRDPGGGADGESRVKGDKGKPRINMNSWGGEEDRDIEA